MLTDLHQATRALRHTPVFSAVIVLTLALGIGANTALFSVADAVLLRPLPYPDSDRLVAIEDASFLIDWRTGSVRPEAEDGAAFVGIGTYVGGDVNIGGDPAPERVRAAAVSPGFFRVLDPEPVLGRVFTAEDLALDLHQVVISEALWKRRGATLKPGGQLVINGRAFTISGVMPPLVDFPGGADVWIPADSDSQLAGGASAPALVGRLASSVTPNQAQSELSVLDADRTNERNVRVILLGDQLAAPVRPVFIALAISVALLLMVACLNVACLMLARVSARERDIATRRALGATNGQLVRLLLCESVLLSVGGGILAVPMAFWSLSAIRAVLPTGLSGADVVSIDQAALLVTAALCVMAMCTFSIAPVVSLRRAGAAGALRSKSPGSTEPFWRRFRSGLVVGELAIVLVLLAGAVTVGRTVHTLLSVDLGATGDRALTIEATLPLARYDSLERLTSFYDQVAASVGALPGVEAFGVTTRLPGAQGLGTGRRIVIDGHPAPQATEQGASYLSASPDYFRAIGIPIIAGRPFGNADRAKSRPVAIISEDVARRVGLSPAQAIGERIAIGMRGNSLATIVGVVRDVRLQGPEADAGAQIYVPMAQHANFGTTFLVVKTAGNPTALVPALRAAIGRVDSDLPIYNVRTFEQLRASSLAAREFATTVLSAFALLGLCLAGIGLYGTLTYFVQLQTSEIGIRMALGATPATVQWRTLRHGVLHGVLAVAVGAIASWLVLRIMTNLVPGLQRPDISVLSAAAAALLIAVVPICWLPARRASTIDPLRAMRVD